MHRCIYICNSIHRIMIKWAGAVIGFLYMRFPGAITGFMIGSLLDYFLKGNVKVTSSSIHQNSAAGDFEVNLLSLCSIVIKADGNVSQKELDYVRLYFVRSYGKQRANAIFRTFNKAVNKTQVNAAQLCEYFYARTSYEVRLQILHFLFGITQADGNVSTSELDELEKISRYLRLSPQDFESIKAMFFKSADHAYKILEIDPSASEAEVKKAYRTMVKKYHPDKLVHMDEAYRKGAKEKFNKVQEAYEQIQKERGF